MRLYEAGLVNSSQFFLIDKHENIGVPKAKFQQFFRGYLDVLKSNFKQVSVMGNDGKERYRYYTCGQEHDRRNLAWEPFQHLMRYCQELGYDFYEARDMIEERTRRKLICECELLKS